MVNIDFTTERMIPGTIPVPLFNEHEDRYNFAALFVRDKFVVDIACGVGIGTQLLREAGATQVIGVDKDAGAVEYAREVYRDCIFVACDAQNLLLENNSADVIVSFETIEHLHNPTGFLKECRRVLKAGGLFICSTPNHGVNRWWRSNPYHIREFMPEEFLKLTGSFFVDLEVYGQGRVLYPAFVGKRVVSDLLEKIHLKKPVTRLLARAVPAMSQQTKFTLNRARVAYEIQRYTKNWMIKPNYLVLTAHKPEHASCT